jgi:ribokinase
MKLGALGSLIVTRDAAVSVPAHRVTAVDTTAAGDVFNGAFAVALAEGMPPEAAARFATAAAAISVQRAGAQSSVPSRSEIDSFRG